MAPTESGEAAVVVIGRDPLAARLDREGGEVRVANEISSGARLPAEALEDRPVAPAWRDRDGVRLSTEDVHELQRRLDGFGR